MTLIGILFALIALAGWLYLTFLHGWFWWPLQDVTAPDVMKWPKAVIVVPARNEITMLSRSLNSLLEQDYPGEWHIVLVDDHSTDGTGDFARKLAEQKFLSHRLTVITAPALEKGWNGKVAAMQAGVAENDAPYIMFTDADIEHRKHSLRNMVARSLVERLDLNSLMVRLHCDTVAEELLIPAFVYFFALLYPFRKINDPTSNVAGAAGGVMLVKREALVNAGGMGAIKSTLIDDCSLARIIKDSGGAGNKPGRLRLVLSDDIVSLRSYWSIKEVMAMISRTAFTQLRHSSKLLAGTVAGILLLFLVPLLLLLFGGSKAIMLSFAAWLLMTFTYLQTVRFYRLSFVWAFTLPIAAVIYIAATLESARQYRQGQGGQWKDRAQAQ